MEQKKQTVLAIGAHIGDAELTAGALLATCAVHGGKAVTLALTAGEKGAPIGADIVEYRRSKIAEAEAFARELGGEAYVLDYADGLLPDNDEVRFAVCDIIRKVKPEHITTLRDSFLKSREASLKEEGCEAFEIYQSVLDPTIFLIYELWTTDEAHTIHSSLPHSKVHSEECQGINEPSFKTKVHKIFIK